MKTTVHTALAAALVATAVLGGASAAFAGGSYYEGINPTPLSTERAPKAVGSTTLNIRGSEAGYIDRTATGSVYNYDAKPRIPQGGEGEYYQGISR